MSDIDRASLLVEADETARPVKDGESAVGIFVHAYAGANVVMAMALGRNLQAAPVPGDAIVAAHHTILLDAEHIIERAADIADEG